MESFFRESRIWRGGPYLHVLALLGNDPGVRAYARAHRDLLGQYAPQLAAVPEQWLHCTVQGIHHPTTTQQTRQLRAVLREELRDTAPVTVQLGPTWPGVTAITVAMYPEDQMAALNKKTRAAMESVPGITLRPAEANYWAHATIAYTKDAFDDRGLNRALRALRPQRVDLTIDRVHLVRQYQDLQAGIYTWDVIEEFVLAHPAP